MDMNRKPKRALRWFYRAPIWLYRVGLGRIMGGRFLMLTHRGRKSGLPRYAVLEVVGRSPGVWYVAAAYGKDADWYRNILADPQVQVNYRGRISDAIAETLTVGDAEQVLREYAVAHPRAARALGKAMHVPLETDARAAAETIPIVALRAV